MLFRAAFALSTVLLLSACGGGGGGGGAAVGGSTTPTPPPVTPTIYTSNCATALNALSCQNKLALTGPFAQLLQSSSGPPNFSVGGNDESFYALQIDRKNTLSDPLDDTYVLGVGVSVNYTTYGILNVHNDGLGVVRTGVATSPMNVTSQLDLFEMSNVLGGGLDYILIARVSNFTGGPTLSTSGAPNAAYMVLGQINYLSNLPTTGTAQYAGGTRGSYVQDTSTVLSTKSDLSMTVDFGSHMLNGSATNFTAVNASGNPVTLTDNLNFTFSGNIATSGPFAEFTGTAAGAIMQGKIYGSFYGNTVAGQEAGLAYSLTKPGSTPANGPTMFGAGGMKRTN